MTDKNNNSEIATLWVVPEEGQEEGCEEPGDGVVQDFVVGSDCSLRCAFLFLPSGSWVLTC